MNTRSKGGFTIVELLIVIVVIAVLAAVTIVAFNGLSQRARVSQAASQLDQARKKVREYFTINSTYPASLADAGVPDTNGSAYIIASSGSVYCISVETAGKTYRVLGDSGTILEGGCQAGSTNLALNATVTSSVTSDYGRPISRITNGNTDTEDYFEAQPGTAYVTVDLGSPQLVGRVVSWHFYGNPRSYNNNLIQTSVDGSTWTTLFNSAVAGPFIETASGHSISFPVTQVRYIRDTITGSSSNPGNHWVEIQAY